MAGKFAVLLSFNRPTPKRQLVLAQSRNHTIGLPFLARRSISSSVGMYVVSSVGVVGTGLVRRPAAAELACCLQVDEVFDSGRSLR